MKDTQLKKSILVIGGGTAGWVSLAYLAATTDAELTIIHSEEVDSIGVGESTTPTIRHVAEACRIDESVWMRDAKATFKYGIEFLDFDRRDSRWFHTFDDLLPAQLFHTPMADFGKIVWPNKITSVDYFLYQRQKGVAGYDIDWFNHSQGASEFLLSQRLSPYSAHGELNFSSFPGYSYHINAQEFGNSLRKHTNPDRYTELRGHVVDFEQDHTGVKCVILQDGRRLAADLFIDCTGFRRVLMSKLTQFRPYSEMLNNAAIWGPVKAQVDRPSTLSRAQPHGWIWETPTWGQIGSGYVFSDDFITVDQAEAHMRQHWANQGLHWEPLRSVRFTSGRLEDLAVKNVVANGLGQSFIEPLEATSIVMACTTIKVVSEMWRRHQGWDLRATQVLNTAVRRFLDETKEFVLAHYTLSHRQDTDYWRAYDRTQAVEATSNWIERKLKHGWQGKTETQFNGYNWASMLVAYDQPYLGQLPDIQDWQLEEYEHGSRRLVDQYQYICRNNVPVAQHLQRINSTRTA